MSSKALSRREMLKFAALGLGGLALRPWYRQLATGSPDLLPQFPAAERLGRVLEDKVKVKARPDDDSPTVKELADDTIVVWLRQVVGRRPLWSNQNYVETPEGYIYAPNVQPVRDQPNQPLSVLPSAGGMWVETTVPYVDLVLANPPSRSPWLEYTRYPRLYYSQIMWVDQIKTDDQGQVLYHVMEKYGSYGDMFWAPGQAFRPVMPEEITPINPDAAEKLVVVNLSYQTLACMEGNSEVYFCRVSTGPKVSSEENPALKWATPVGKHTIWRKMVSTHMTGGTSGGGYDLPGIGWTTLFSGKGMAIHSTFWHNGYGVPLSHGCVNAAPDDAKWIFRWTLPVTSLDPGDIVIQGQGSTRVLVVED